MSSNVSHGGPASAAATLPVEDHRPPTDAAPHAGAHAPRIAPLGTAGVLFAMCLSLVLVVSSVSMLNLALPDIAVGLGATNSDLTWIADAFTVALAGLVLPFGALGDRLGRRTLLVIGNVVFGAAALAASQVHTPGHLIALRAVMGLGAALIMPGTLSTITASFPVDRRDRGVAVWSGFATAGAILGMLAAGALLRHWSWRAIFVASAITAVVAAVSAVLLAPNTRDDDPPTPDLAGAALLATAVTCLVYAIIEGNDSSWTAGRVVAAAVVCALAFVGWVLVDARSSHPILDPRLFLLRGFTAGTIALVAQFMALFGFFFVGLQYLQLMLGYSPLKAAVALVPVALVVLPVTLATPRLTRWMGMRAIMSSGLVLIALGMAGLHQLDTGSGYRPFLLGLLAAGLGLGLCSSTGTVAITGALPASKQGVASAMNDVTREVGSAIGIAVMGSTYSNAYAHALPNLTRLPQDLAGATRDSAAAGLAAAQKLATTHPSEAAQLTGAVHHAFMSGFTRSFLVTAIIVLAAGVVTMVLTPRRTPQATDQQPVEPVPFPDDAATRPATAAQLWLMRSIARTSATTGHSTPAALGDDLRCPDDVLVPWVDNAVEAGFVHRDQDMLRLTPAGTAALRENDTDHTYVPRHALIHGASPDTIPTITEAH